MAGEEGGRSGVGGEKNYESEGGRKKVEEEKRIGY